MNDLINQFTKELSQLTNAAPKIGIELEFYYMDDSVEKLLQKLPINNHGFSKETGKNQYEIQLAPTTDISLIINQYNKIFQHLKNDPNVNLTPKPFDDQPSNGIHIHINLLDKQTQNNLFNKQTNTESLLLLHSIAGLLSLMEESLIIFAPTIESYKRYHAGINNPTKICWGANNRTTAIRIPSSESKGDRRIEHRIPAPGCNITDVISVILFSIIFGIQNKLDPGEKIYGNAFLEQYPQKRLALSFEEAYQKYQQGSYIKELIRVKSQI
jgi:glutamine synthetase